MAKPISIIQDIAEKLIYDNRERNNAFEAYEQMYHNGFDLPKMIAQLPWIMKVISSDPHDAIDAGTRILGTLPVSVQFQPLAPGDANKQRANEIEKNLSWQLRSANRRRSKSVEAEVMKSALLYDAIAMQVVDLDWQIEQKRLMALDAKRELMMRRFGRFMIKTYNPRSVYARYSGLMPEAVLLRQLREVSDIIDEFGGAVVKKFPYLEELAVSKANSKIWYLDYVDYDTRAIWLVPGTSVAEASTVDVHGEAMTIFHGDNELPFLPWVAMMGGDSMEDNPVHKYKPILYPIYTSGAWDIQNIIETLMVSEAIAHTGSPQYKEEGQNIQESDFDYGSPERIAKVPPGNILSPLSAPQLDRALSELDALFGAKIDKATVSRILQGGDLPSGIAFATLNLATQTAVGVLKPSKSLAQKSLAEMFTIMLLWVEFTKKDLYAYNTVGKEQGEELVIKSEWLDPEALYVETQLHPDTPTDKQQKVNTAAMAVRELYMPIEMALEEIGIDDPPGAVRQAMKERKLQHMQDMEFKEEEGMLDLKLQGIAMQMQQQMQQAQMQQQQMAQMGQQAQQEMFQQGTGQAAPGGQGFNPEQAGQPPAEANPSQTREQVSGVDFLGNETTGLANQGL